MATVKNESYETLEVPLYGLCVGPGESVEVDDEIGAEIGSPFSVVKAAAPAAPSADTTPPLGGTIT